MGFPTFVTGRGMVDSDVLSVDRAVNEYDERLYFDQNPDTGQYCVYLKTPASEPDTPLLGWDRPPHPDDALKRLWVSDSLRHGEEILEGMRRRNADAFQPFKDKSEDAAGQAAEGLEWGFRKMGAHPTGRIFVPRST